MPPSQYVPERKLSMVLTTVQSGKDYIIHAVTGEGDTRLHLGSMGFVPGTKLSVVSRLGGNLIVSVKGSRVALDEKLAKCVMV